MEYLIFFGIIIAFIIIAKIFSWPVKIVTKLIINIVVGLVLILFINLLGQPMGLYIPFNKITAVITGILGIPGVILMLIYTIIF